MATKGFKGSILLEILIVLMALLLIAVILVPNKIWKEEDKVTKKCRHNLNALYEAERFYYQKMRVYTDSLNKLFTVVQSDTGLNRRQTLVSLTNSFTTVLNNILGISTIDKISKISQAISEIRQDLISNERYFRIYPEIVKSSEDLIIDINRIDSSITFPNFSRTKIFVDSLRDLEASVSEYSLQVAILKAINTTDSLVLYFPKIEQAGFAQYWNEQSRKISAFISAIRATDISKVSTVPDRLKKFIDQTNSNLGGLNIANFSRDRESLEQEKQNLTELHQKFLSPRFFNLTTSYSLTKLDEIDSILISINQDYFICPDARTPYLIDTTMNRLILECPNLLDKYHSRFLKAAEPIRELPLYVNITELGGIIENTKMALDKNRETLRRYTEILLKIKELQVEFDQIQSITFYYYVTKIHDFVRLVQTEKKLSVLKPKIEDILNPLDTLAARIEKMDISDLEKKINYYHEKLKEIDESINSMKLPANVKNQVVSNTQPFEPAFQLLGRVKTGSGSAVAKQLRDAERELEKSLIDALEGEREQMFIIFSKSHINHGSIVAGEKSWEQD